MLAKAQYINVEETNPCDADFLERFSSESEVVYAIFFHGEGDIHWFRISDAWTTIAKVRTFSYSAEYMYLIY